jgi:tetratricopeptide (TPR) repeat protein
MNPSPPSLAPEEQEQILQTIEMFEVIVQANPQDCQSMEILKDAYWRLGMKKEMTAMTRRLAEALAEAGQFSTALLEYENLLKLEPDNLELISAMGEVEERMHKAAKAKPKAAASIEMDFKTAVSDSGTLMTTAATQRPDGFSRGAAFAAERLEEVTAGLAEDGNEALAKFLIQHRLVPEDIVESALDRALTKNEGLAAGTLGASLIHEIVRLGGADLEHILCGILDRTKFAFIPLDCYDVDRQVAKMLPEALTLSRLMIPFDVMSRTVMIATANPFDAQGKEAAQQLLDYSIQWHLAAPEALFRVLGQTHRLDGSASIREKITFEPAPAPASTATPMSAPVPVPPIAVTNGEAPLTPTPPMAAALPDTSTFRIKS